MGFEPTISTGERPETHVLDRAATSAISYNLHYCVISAVCVYTVTNMAAGLVIRDLTFLSKIRRHFERGWKAVIPFEGGGWGAGREKRNVVAECTSRGPRAVSYATVL